MFDPVTIKIIDAEEHDMGLKVKVAWTWGSTSGELIGFTGDWPASANEVRAVASAWVIDRVERDHELDTLKAELMDDGWTIEFESEEDPFREAEHRSAERFLPLDGFDD